MILHQLDKPIWWKRKPQACIRFRIKKTFVFPSFSQSAVCSCPCSYFILKHALGNQIDEDLGLGIIEHVDATGQIIGTSAIAVDEDALCDFIVDDNWETRWNKPELKPYETLGGVKVRSRAEYIIATTLESNNIHFEYEPKLPYRDGDRTRYIHPDFHLYEHDLYVEYWGKGKTEKAYIETRQCKEQVYAKLSRRNIQVLHIEADEIEYNVFWEKIQQAIQL